MTRKRIITTAIVIVAVLVVALIGWAIYRHIYSATIRINIAPKSSTITINNGGGRIGDNYVKPGEYTVRITKQGFTSYTEKVTLRAGGTVTVEAGLSPSSDATADWYEKHHDDYDIAQGIWDRKADQAAARMLRDYPLIKVLPMIGPFESYRVDYGLSPEQSNKYIIIIRSQSEDAKQQALAAIRSAGYDISRYEVQYKSNALTDGGTSLQNTISLTNRGVSKSVLNRLKTVLGSQYPGDTLLFADDTSHDILDDGGTHVYTVSFSINGEGSYRLVVTVRDMATVEVKVGNQTLYSGEI